MSQHAAPAPALFSRPGTYLVAAALVSGALLGAAAAPALVAVAVAAALALLAAAPAPGERPDPAHRATPQAYITAAVYVTCVAHLMGVRFGRSRPLEPEAVAGSRPLESEGWDACWCGCGGRFLVAADAAGRRGSRELVGSGRSSEALSL